MERYENDDTERSCLHPRHGLGDLDQPRTLEDRA